MIGPWLMTKHKKTNTKVWVETSRDPAVKKNKHTTNLSGLLQFTRRSCSFEKLIQTCCKCTFYDRLAACVKIGSNVLKRITFTYLVLHPSPFGATVLFAGPNKIIRSWCLVTFVPRHALSVWGQSLESKRTTEPWRKWSAFSKDAC